MNRKISLIASLSLLLSSAVVSAEEGAKSATEEAVRLQAINLYYYYSFTEICQNRYRILSEAEMKKISEYVRRKQPTLSEGERASAWEEGLRAARIMESNHRKEHSLSRVCQEMQALVISTIKEMEGAPA